MRYQLVFQFDSSTIEEYDAMISLEDRLIAGLPKSSKVDGHDAGSGEMNVFIHTDDPIEAFEIGAALIREAEPLREFRAAYRELTSEGYHLLWPPGLTEFHMA